MPKKNSQGKRPVVKQEAEHVQQTDEAYMSPKRARLTSKKFNNTETTPVVNSEQRVVPRTPKSDLKQFMEGMGSPLPFGICSPSPSLSVPFTPGSTGLLGGVGDEASSSNAVNMAIPSSRDWSPLCNSSVFDFDGPSSLSVTTPQMDKVYQSFRGGSRTDVSTEQGHIENMSSTWGGNLGNDIMGSDRRTFSSPTDVMGFPSAPLSSSSMSSSSAYQDHLPPMWKDMQHLYPHHTNTVGLSGRCRDVQRMHQSNDLFSANEKKHRIGDTITNTNSEWPRGSISPTPISRSELDSSAPPSPGIDAIAAAARTIENHSADRSGRMSKDIGKERPPLAAAHSLKGVVGKLSYNKNSEGEQYPCMNITSSSNAPKSCSKGSYSKGVLPYLPQKQNDIASRKSLASEIQTYMQGNDSSINEKQSEDNINFDLAHSPQMLEGTGSNKVFNISPVMKKANVTCNCKKTKCLKLYCDCFRMQQYCNGCHCNNCANLKEFEDERQAAIATITERNPEAFKPRITRIDAHFLSPAGPSVSRVGQHLQGCHCKKSACLKKYCECFQAEVACHERCRCLECKNTPAEREAKLMSSGDKDKSIGSIRRTVPVASTDFSNNGDLRDGSSSSHLDLKTSLLSPFSSSPNDRAFGSTEDDLRPIYNRAQAEQAALEIVSAFLRGELTVPGLEYLNTKPSAMQKYYCPGNSASESKSSVEQSSIPLMEKLGRFEEAREKRKCSDAQLAE